MEKMELFDLLKNYGVIMNKDLQDLEEDKLREAALMLKNKSDENIKRVQEEQKPIDPTPDMKREEKEEPVATFYTLGYNNKQELLNDIQALRTAKKEAEARKAELPELEKSMEDKSKALDIKEQKIQAQSTKLAQEYKQYQDMHDKLVAAKKNI